MRTSEKEMLGVNRNRSNKKYHFTTNNAGISELIELDRNENKKKA